LTYSLVTAMQKYTKTIYMKIWETELFALNFKTGELEGVITETFFGGETLVEAQQNLNKSNKPYLRLTGDWYNGGSKSPEVDENWLEGKIDESIDRIKKDWEEKEMDFEIHWTPFKPEDADDEAKQRKNIEKLVTEMSIDDFIDWLDEQDKEYLLKLLKTLDSIGNLDAYIKTIEGHLTHKYGGSKENDEEDLK
jgi:hypothetical protein